MTERRRGEVELGGTTFHLKFDFNAIAELEEMLGGDSVPVLMQKGMEKLGVRFLRAAICAGLLHDKKLSRGITPQKVGRLLNGHNFSAAYEAVGEAIADAFPKAEEEGDSGNFQGLGSEPAQ